MGQQLVTERLALRPWAVDDTEAALGAYGDADVARWLAPAMSKAGDAAAMRLVPLGGRVPAGRAPDRRSYVAAAAAR
jgi:hypothetical protein